MISKNKIFFIVASIFITTGLYAQPYKYVYNQYTHKLGIVQANPGVAAATQVIAGTNLSGGGALSSDVTLNLVDPIVLQGIDFSASSPAHSEGLLFYDGTYKTLSLYNDETEVALQLGQEMWARVRNITGSDISNGKVVYINGYDSGLPTIALANAANAATSIGVLGVATHTIETGTNGYITNVGDVHDVDTSSFLAGDLLYLDMVDGGLTKTAPDSPNYRITIGNVGVVDASTGTINVNIGKFGNTSGVISIFNGSILEDHLINIVESGGTVSLTLQQNPTGDLHLFFNAGFVDFDATPAASVNLTAGSDTSPTLNYVYILESTTTLTASTVGWPSAQHVPVATVLVQSAASVALYGAYKVHAWTDHLSSGTDQGHLSDVNYWIRQQNATWQTGVATTPTVGAGVFDVATTSGIVLQLHQHTFPAFNTATGSDIYIVNDSITAFKRLGDLTTVLTDSNGVSMSGKHYPLVIWGVVNEEDGDCKLMCNLPSGSYTSSAAAISDTSKYSNFTIPANFKGTGFLISRLVVQHSVAGGGTFVISKNEDLRGQYPQVGAGGAQIATTTFSDNSFQIYNVTDATKIAKHSSSGITTGTTRTFTYPDANGTFMLGDLGSVTGDIAYWDGSKWTPDSKMNWDSVNENFNITGTTGAQASFNYDSNYGVDITVDSAGEMWITQSSLASAINTFVGALCGTSNTGATVYGFGRAAVQNNSGDYCSGFGLHALRNNTADFCDAFGRLALENNTGIYSAGFGNNALTNNTGPYVSGIGALALRDNTGWYASAIGGLSGVANIGNYTAFAGYTSGAYNLGSYALFFGSLSGYWNTSDNVVGLGSNSGQYNSGAQVSFTGVSSGKYNQSDYAGAFGYNAWGAFLDNAGGAKTFDNTDINITTDRITINTHGFGATNAYVNLRYTEGTAAITGLTDNSIYQVRIIDANTIGLYEAVGPGGANRGTNITDAGSGTGHTFTPQSEYDNAIVIGNNSVPTAADSIFLAGDMEHLYIGSGATGIDYDVVFDGETNDGTLTYMEDEDRFDFGSETLVTGLSIRGKLTAPRIDSGAADYNPSILTVDYLITVDNSSTGRQVIISTEDVQSGTTSAPRFFIVKDEQGVAGSNNITVSLESGNIDGAATKVISVNYDSISIYVDGTNGWVYK